MGLFIVDEKKCTRTGICVAECPAKIIEMRDDGSVPTPVEGAEDICITCGHCVAVCPHGAISLGTMKVEDCPPIRRDLMLSAEQVEQFLRSRRSIRTYQEREIEKDVLKKVIDLGRYAPSGSNSQQVQWLVYYSRDKVKELTEKAVDWMRFLVSKKEPIAEQYRMARIIEGWENGLDIITRGAPGLIITHAPKDYAVAQIDSAIALTFVDLAAPTFGLGTCWAGFFMIAASYWPPLQRALALPEDHTTYGAMMIGYPKYKYQRLPLRKEPKVTWIS